VDIAQATDECGDSVAVLEFPMKTSRKGSGLRTYVRVDAKLIVVPAFVEVCAEQEDVLD